MASTDGEQAAPKGAITWTVVPLPRNSILGPLPARHYGCPRIIPGEALISWICRVGAKLAMSPRAVLRKILDPTRIGLRDRKQSPHHLNAFRVGYATCNNPQTLSSAMRWLSLLGISFSPNDRKRHTRFCPQCLAEDEVPYIRNHWLLPSALVCERHQAVLSDRCSACASPIDFFIRKVSLLMPYEHSRVLSYCPTCAASLAEGTSALLPRPLFRSLVRFHRRFVQQYEALSRHRWKRSRFADFCRKHIEYIERHELSRPAVWQETVVHKRTIWRYRIKWWAVVGASQFDDFREWFDEPFLRKEKGRLQELLTYANLADDSI